MELSTFEIGEIVQHKGRFYKVKADTPEFEACKNCAFVNEECMEFSCLSDARQDHKTVVFAECDEAGNEFPTHPTHPTFSRAIYDIIRAAGINAPTAEMTTAMKTYAQICICESLRTAEECIKIHEITDEKNVVLL